MASKNTKDPIKDPWHKAGHAALVVLYWFALIGLIGEQGNPKTANGTGRFLVLVLIVFGVWRVVRKRMRLRREREMQIVAAATASDDSDNNAGSI